ncbi:sugar transporter [Desulfonema ishimotonii]|uniref:Sugar transporter n=1 Tax=Desulfonema ishimotonii TaxID=45657 RepID=A0A401FVE0_9BACT|nr:polysaccharide biosynthesis/export family protein [Desulfonema ishimotonii]GBC60914.1 sugar transporter [Desulfonema ishimotonii]
MKKRWFSVCVVMLVFMAGAAGAEEAFRIGPGDVLEISVWRDESLSRKVVVPPDGIISFPLIGDIAETRLTVRELRTVLTQKLAEYVPDATVTVMLLEIRSLNAYVIGKVNRPGEYPVSMDTSVMQLLSMAGGLNPFASEKKIHVLRQTDGKTRKIPFNYKEVLKGINLGQNILLQRGDVIVVP